MEKRNRTAMKIVMESTGETFTAQTEESDIIQHGPRIVDYRDLAVEFFMKNEDALTRLVDAENHRIKAEEEQKAAILRDADEASRLADEFLSRKELPPCAYFFYKLKACNGEPTLYLFMNDEQTIIMREYFKGVIHYFNREWYDAEYGLLETRRKIQKRIDSLYGIQQIVPSKMTESYKLWRRSITDAPKIYKYINVMGVHQYLMAFKFIDFLPWETPTKDKRNFTIRSIIKDIEQDINDNGAVLTSFMEYIYDLDTDLTGLTELKNSMSFMDKLRNWGSYRLINFFLDSRKMIPVGKQS